jgi:septal ring factor EnvC (AmiA/AmiB activator)
MQSIEERIALLERGLASLEKKFNTNIQDVNHHATMLLGLAYKQQDDTREIEETLREHSSKFDSIDHRLDEHTKILNEHSSKFASIENRLEKIESQSVAQTNSINENTKLLANMLALLTKLSND